MNMNDIREKLPTILIAGSIVLMVAATTFQVLEMCDYKLFETIFKSSK